MARTARSGTGLAPATSAQRTRSKTWRFCEAHGLRVREFRFADSAWKGGGAEYKTALTEALDAAWGGEFTAIVVWSLDRITRSGAEGALRFVRTFRERGRKAGARDRRPRKRRAGNLLDGILASLWRRPTQ